MFQVFRAIGYKVHFVLHRFFISEFYVYIVPTSQILHDIFQCDIIKIEIAVFPINIRVQIYFCQNEIAVRLKMCIFAGRVWYMILLWYC